MDTLYGYPLTFSVEVDGKSVDLTSTLSVRDARATPGGGYEPAVIAAYPNAVANAIGAHRRERPCCCQCVCRK